MEVVYASASFFAVSQSAPEVGGVLRAKSGQMEGEVQERQTQE